MASFSPWIQRIGGLTGEVDDARDVEVLRGHRVEHTAVVPGAKPGPVLGGDRVARIVVGGDPVGEHRRDPECLRVKSGLRAWLRTPSGRRCAARSARRRSCRRPAAARRSRGSLRRRPCRRRRRRCGRPRGRVPAEAVGRHGRFEGEAEITRCGASSRSCRTTPRAHAPADEMGGPDRARARRARSARRRRSRARPRVASTGSVSLSPKPRRSTARARTAGGEREHGVGWWNSDDDTLPCTKHDGRDRIAEGGPLEDVRGEPRGHDGVGDDSVEQGGCHGESFSK